MMELERVLADPETKATVVNYGEDFVKVRYPLDLRVSKEELDTDSLEEEEDTSPADDEEVKDTDNDHHDAMSEDTL